ncbi:MAG TPA: TIGR00730 family Rossman fold protein [Tepidisphaeraceae bacterium]|jgi:hypothetical protein|nr:TIGR00730 family Rossman fold protein [Tepidisphaeraceae bacterium]
MAIQSVTVFCSSSRHVAPVYFAAAEEVGRGLALRGITLVYGGNAIGTMGALADACRTAGGQVVGITPKVLVDEGITDNNCNELIVTPDMRQRKAQLESRGDAFLILPGGIGTLEEFFEILVGKILGVHAKPIILLNIAGFFDPLLAAIDHAVTQNFAKPKARSAFAVAASADEALAMLAIEPL